VRYEEEISYDICLQGWRKRTRLINENNMCLSRYFNPESLQYGAYKPLQHEKYEFITGPGHSIDGKLASDMWHWVC